MTDLSFPPWEQTDDEQSVSDHAEFVDCEAVIQSLASKMSSNVIGREYSVSKQWGKVLRAKVVMSQAGLSATTLVTCWSRAKSGVEMMVKVAECGPQQLGC
jgi:hypothetical protein